MTTMSYLFNPKNSKPNRKQLRQEATVPEQRTWMKLKGKQIKGYKFRRQFGIENFIVDFYCPELKLAIEIDGITHSEKVGYDRWREKRLAEFGVHCLRFTDDEVITNLDAVAQKIWNYIDAIEVQNNPS
jgi:very-short-patch-repair endonuclease